MRTRRVHVTASGAIALGVYAAILATVGVFRVTGDGVVYYRFLQRLFGGNPPHPFAYQFGTALWNAPFWAIGLIAHHPEAGVVLGAQVALAVSVYCCSSLLARLGFERCVAIVVVTVLGTPLCYYTVFAPAYSHAADAMVVSVLALALASRARPGMIGALVGFSILVRYANVVWLPAAALPFAAKRDWIRTAHLAATSVAVALAGFAIPVLRGIPYGYPALQDPGQPPRHRLDAQFDPLAPAKMLISLHRGLFLWTPLTLLGVVGFVLLLLRTRDLTLGALGLGSLLLLLAYAGWGNGWDGGFSFSERFLACLLPLFALGVAELARRSAITWPLAGAGIAWSMFLALNHHYGFHGLDAHASFLDVAHGRSPLDLARVVAVHIRGRFG